YRYDEIVRAIGEAVGRVPWMPRLPNLAARMTAAGGSLAKLWMRRPPLVSLDKLPEILAEGWVAGTGKAQALLEGVCPTPLAAGARETAAWYRERGWI